LFTLIERFSCSSLRNTHKERTTKKKEKTCVFAQKWFHQTFCRSIKSQFNFKPFSAAKTKSKTLPLQQTVRVRSYILKLTHSSSFDPPPFSAQIHWSGFFAAEQLRVELVIDRRTVFGRLRLEGDMPKFALLASLKPEVDIRSSVIDSRDRKREVTDNASPV
jgi:hypothetical protein